MVKGNLVIVKLRNSVKISTLLFKKETYIGPTNCCHAHLTKNITYSMKSCCKNLIRCWSTCNINTIFWCNWETWILTYFWTNMPCLLSHGNSKPICKLQNRDVMYFWNDHIWWSQVCVALSAFINWFIFWVLQMLSSHIVIIFVYNSTVYLNKARFALFWN